MLLMTLLTFTLGFMLPRQVDSDLVRKRSRWMITACAALMAVQFALQYFLHLRETGTTQAVTINLLFFIPTAFIFSLAILNLQRRGKIGRPCWISGVTIWVITTTLLLGVSVVKGVPILNDTQEMRIVEYICAILYCVMQANYTYLLIRGNHKLTRTLNNYYDHETDDMLRWMRRSVMLLGCLATAAPIAIFTSGIPLLIYFILVLIYLYYQIFCFICFIVSNDPHTINEAENNAVEAKMDEQDAHTASAISKDEQQRIEKIVQRWLDARGHLHSGITMQTAVEEMHIPRYQLAAWLKTTKWELFNPWLTHLRLEEAMEQMKQHPEWSNDVIAEHCGFSSRSYFQTVFRKQTGLTPAQFLEKLHTNGN